MPPVRFVPALAVALAAVVVSSFIVPSARAGEGFFSRAYNTETPPAGHFEIEQTIRNRSKRAYGSYSAFDLRTEFEYGVTDNFQASLYLNYGRVDADGAPDDDAVEASGSANFSNHVTYFQGFSAEFVYRLLSPVTDPIGLAFYIEPEVAFHDPHNGLPYDTTWATEYRLILQKNFMEDQLITVFNTVAEVEFVRFEKDPDLSWKGELDLNFELGATYRVASNFYAGWEARNHNEIGNFRTHEHSVLWTGPALHYAASHFWATLGVLKQVYGSPNGTDENGNLIGSGNLFLRSHEEWETTVKLAYAF